MPFPVWLVVGLTGLCLISISAALAAYTVGYKEGFKIGSKAQ